MQHIILQNALGIETNCVICSCSPGQAACSRFLWNPPELSFLHTQARCFHSSASFAIFSLYLHLVMVPSPELLLLMSFFHFFLCLQKLFSLCSDVGSEIWERLALLLKDFLASNIKSLVKSVWNGVVLHHFKFFNDFNLLEIGSRLRVPLGIWTSLWLYTIFKGGLNISKSLEKLFWK